MEFSFNIPDWLMTVVDNPIYIVMWAAFGMPIVIFGLAVFFRCLIKLSPWSDKVWASLLIFLFLPLLITWLLGFVVSMILMFIGIIAIKIILIWATILICSLIFFLVNQKKVSLYMDEEEREA